MGGGLLAQWPVQLPLVLRVPGLSHASFSECRVMVF